MANDVVVVVVVVRGVTEEEIVGSIETIGRGL
jgi:hypothetical protein